MECCDHWFLHHLLKRLLTRYRGQIYMQRCITRNRLNKDLSVLYHFTRKETGVILTMLSARFRGIRFTKRGLWISKD